MHSPEIGGRNQMSAGGASGISPNPLVSPQIQGRYNQGASPAYNPISPSYNGNRSVMQANSPNSPID